MYDVIHGISIQSQAMAADINASAARRTASGAKRQVLELEMKVEKSLMVCEALWEFVKRHHNLQDSDLVELVRKIDLKDGKEDGKVSKTKPLKCEECGKTIQRGKNKCMYCGHTQDAGMFDR